MGKLIGNSEGEAFIIQVQRYAGEQVYWSNVWNASISLAVLCMQPNSVFIECESKTIIKFF